MRAGAIMKSRLSVAALWAAFLYLLLLFAVFIVAPRQAHSESWALVVLLARRDDAGAESWQVPTRDDRHAIPTAAGWGGAAAPPLPLSGPGRMPGRGGVGWWCVPEAEAEKFIAANRSEKI